jgi:hypothetical protein
MENEVMGRGKKSEGRRTKAEGRNPNGDPTNGELGAWRMVKT